MEEEVIVTEAHHIDGFRVFLRFSDGVAGEADLAPTIRRLGSVFHSLRDPAEFARLELDTETGTISWPSGADLAPETLHDLVVRSGVGR